MLFKVRWKVNDKIYYVYHIDKFFMDDDYTFLVYDEEKDEWKELSSDECVPVQE